MDNHRPGVTNFVHCWRRATEMAAARDRVAARQAAPGSVRPLGLGRFLHR
jgi:hypothetical protein